ncbi:MAG: cytochrome c3 family protein [bacterium]
MHQQLEGMNNCLQCHETGKEISGKKCLTCHKEIKSALDEKRGFHYKKSSQECIACHKEHLGKNAKTTLFNENTFDHGETGFPRIGKHVSAQCRDCHSKKNIKDARVLAIVNSTGRETYLGLDQQCLSCHADKHNNTVGKDCSKCHSVFAWSPPAGFNHTQTKFALRGKHSTIACSKCHTDLVKKEKNKPVLFATEKFSDCTPCHTSPHSKGFSAKECSSCHTPDGWNQQAGSDKFNHDQTSFRLVGRHAGVACAKCHGSGAKMGKPSLKLAHNKCIDCHSDYHQGEFKTRYNGDCEKCHTPYGFQPATFTLAMHASGRFALSGAHVATPCEKCHVRNNDGRREFDFTKIRCESCHTDKHGGQFTREMKEQSCAACHSTEDWSPKDFDHARTGFVLEGKHVSTKCERCHISQKIAGADVVQYKGTKTKCESCHEEIHAGQFKSNGETDCKKCHQPAGWKTLSFDHNTQSAFMLTGAHKRVECRQCHREERQGNKTFVRFKPLSAKCESCHAQGGMGNG